MKKILFMVAFIAFVAAQDYETSETKKCCDPREPNSKFCKVIDCEEAVLYKVQYE
jgi:hypothetical protein